MIAAAVVGSLLLTPAAVPDAPAAQAAMTSAIAMGCFLHSSGLSPIRADRRKELAVVGLTYVDSPPPTFAHEVSELIPAAWGKAQYSRVEWPAGSAWVVGFAKGQCLIDVQGSDGADLTQAVRDQFEAPGVPWRKLPPGEAPERYGVAVRPPGRDAIAIVANIANETIPPAGRRDVITFEPRPNR